MVKNVCQVMNIQKKIVARKWIKIAFLIEHLSKTHVTHVVERLKTVEAYFVKYRICS